MRAPLLVSAVVSSVSLIAIYAYAAEVSVCSLAADPKGYDHQHMNLRGAVTDLKETRSQRGNDYTLFKLQAPGPCEVKVFVWGHPALHDGDHVCVDGTYTTEVHQGRYTFFDEIQADTARTCGD